MANRKKITKTQMRKHISSFRGIFKRKAGEKSVVQELIEERRAEKEKEDREFIHSLRGSIKFDTGGKPFTEWMADLNREEKELEERKFQRLSALGKRR
jgi:hypothetical protein